VKCGSCFASRKPSVQTQFHQKKKEKKIVVQRKAEQSVLTKRNE
jgi:hypothetical protein